MLAAIVRTEWLQLRADRVILWICLLFLTLTGYALHNGQRWAAARRSASAEQLHLADEKLRQVESGMARGKLAPPEPSSLSYAAVEPPSPLAPLSIGQADLLPSSTNITIYSTKHELFNYYEQDNPLNLLTGRFDLAFAVVFLYPLLVLAMSYNLLSAEREQGTLTMTLSQPVRLSLLVVGKAFPRWALLVALGAGLPMLWLGAGTSLSQPGAVAGLALWAAAVTLYISFWFTAGVLVNALGRSSASNATMLVGLWLAVVVVYPPLLNLAASTVYPLPSRLAYISRVREADTQTRTSGQKLLAKYYGDHPELAPEGQRDLSDFTTRFYTMRQENQRQLLPDVLRYEARLNEQQRLIDRFRFVSPAIVLQELMNTIAGNDRGRQLAFVHQAREFLDEWQAALVSNVFGHVKLGPLDIARLPRFRFQEPESGASRAYEWTSLAGLSGPVVVALALALLALRRFPVADR